MGCGDMRFYDSCFYLRCSLVLCGCTLSSSLFSHICVHVNKEQECGQGKKKPAWALTTEEATKLNEDEEKSLLDFAEGLDFDQFISEMDDIDVKEALTVGILKQVSIFSPLIITN